MTVCPSWRAVCDSVSFVEGSVRQCVLHGDGGQCATVCDSVCFVEMEGSVRQCVLRGGQCATVCPSWRVVCDSVSFVEGSV